MTIPTPLELDALSPPNPEIAADITAFAAALPDWSAHTNEDIIHELRKHFAAFTSPPEKGNAEHFKSSYQTKDGTDLRLLVWRPQNVERRLPLFVYYHGGGYCVGRPEQATELYSEIALKHNCVVVAPEYRLAPEFKWPTGMDDTWDALKHIATHDEQLGADGRLGLVVGGESAGAGIASILALRARDEKLKPPVTGAFLSAGSYVNPEDVPAAYKELYRSRTDDVCTASPILNSTLSTAFMSCHAADNGSPRFRAALDPERFAQHPRTYLQTCGNDMNRDDGFIYNDMLEKHGVETKLDVYPGGPHCFWMMFREAEMTKKWWKDTHAGVAWLLESH